MLDSQRGYRPTRVRLTVKFSIKNSSSNSKNSCAFVDVKIPSFARRKDFARNESWWTFPLRFPRYVDSVCTERRKLNRENTRSSERRSCMSASCLGTGWINLPSERSLRTSRRKGNEYRRVVGSAEIAPGEKKRRTDGNGATVTRHVRSLKLSSNDAASRPWRISRGLFERAPRPGITRFLLDSSSSFQLLLHSILTTDF